MALPGVAIAVALVPPLCVAGWGLGAGFKGIIFRGAMVLFLTNLTAIVFLSLLVFLSLGIGNTQDAPAIRGVLDQVEKRGFLAGWTRSHPWFARFRRVGGLRSRILLVAIAVVMLYIPLNSGLRQVKRELLVNREVRNAIPTYLGEYTLLSRKVTPMQDGALVHLTLVSEHRSPAGAISSMESYLKGKLGAKVTIDFTEVARGTYLPTQASAASAAPQQGLHQVVSQVRMGALSSLVGLWPENSGYALAGLSLVVPSGVDSPGVRVTYIAEEEVPAAASEAFRLAAQRTLEISPLALELRRVPRIWGELDLSRPPGTDALRTWSEAMRERAASLPSGVHLKAILRHPEGFQPGQVERYENWARKALESLSEGPWEAVEPPPHTLEAVPIRGSSARTLLLEAEPSGVLPSQ
jgi:hypothetical protein